MINENNISVTSSLNDSSASEDNNISVQQLLVALDPLV